MHVYANFLMKLCVCALYCYSICMSALPDSYVCQKPEGREHAYQARYECPCYN